MTDYRSSASPIIGAPAARLPLSIWTLGVVSLLMDVSSELIHAYLPLFVVGTLGASVALLGLIEGIAEGTASVAKLASGWVSDRLKNRKWLVVGGYSLSALTKPLFALAGGPVLVLGARFADRVGKGIRGAPRDALIGDIVAPGMRGAAYGLRQSLDNVGAFLGPVLGIIFMALLANDVRAVFWLAVIPACLAVAALIFGIKEPERAPAAPAAAIAVKGFGTLGAPFWGILTVACLLTLGRFSEAFLILKAEATGLPFALAPIVFIVMNVVTAAAAYPIGRLSDRLGRRGFIVAGALLLIAADVALAISGHLAVTLLAVALFGLHLGFTQGVIAALLADVLPAERRGTGFGLYQLATGLSLLLASVIAGGLWSVSGPTATFAFSAAVTGLGLLSALALLRPRTWRSAAP